MVREVETVLLQVKMTFNVVFLEWYSFNLDRLKAADRTIFYFGVAQKQTKFTAPRSGRKKKNGMT
jgi:hypothetical protein